MDVDWHHATFEYFAQEFDSLFILGTVSRDTPDSFYWRPTPGVKGREGYISPRFLEKDTVFIDHIEEAGAHHFDGMFISFSFDIQVPNH